MSDLKERFDQAQIDVKGSTRKPSNDDLLVLYSHYKQATAGEASASKKPGRFDLVGKAKYDAWTKLSGMSVEQAMTGYIAKVDQLLGR